jgi:UDP-glucose 4-epimerase
VLGDGHQRKSYLYVQDCIDAMLLVIERSEALVTIANLGTQEYVEVNQSLGYICDALGVTPERVYAGGARGWIGDSPFILLDTTRVRAMGWTPKLTIREGIERTLAYLRENAWLLERRA